MKEKYYHLWCLLERIVYIKQLFDEVFVISRIIKVEVRFISRSRRLKLITLTNILIILISQKPNLIIVLFYNECTNLEVMFLPLHWRQATWVVWSWHDYPWKSCTAVIYDMITHDLDMITRDLDMTLRALISKIHSALLANEKRVIEFNCIIIQINH